LCDRGKCDDHEGNKRNVNKNKLKWVSFILSFQKYSINLCSIQVIAFCFLQSSGLFVVFGSGGWVVHFFMQFGHTKQFSLGGQYSGFPHGQSTGQVVGLLQGQFTYSLISFLCNSFAAASRSYEAIPNGSP
jgi:hypothetical protein